jgi:methyl-accepting chemotaxis protein
MNKMADGIKNISHAMAESADGVSMATENVSALANSISEIKEDALSNRDVSNKLLSEVERFQKI